MSAAFDRLRSPPPSVIALNAVETLRVIARALSSPYVALRFA